MPNFWLNGAEFKECGNGICFFVFVYKHRLVQQGHRLQLLCWCVEAE